MEIAFPEGWHLVKDLVVKRKRRVKVHFFRKGAWSSVCGMTHRTRGTEPMPDAPLAQCKVCLSKIGE